VLTERLRLRPPRPGDLDVYVAVFTHPAVRTWLRPEPEPPATRADIEAMIVGDVELWQRLGYGPWAVFDRGDDVFLGRVGLQPRKLPGEEATEIVWTIDPARHGEGLATEAALAAVELARQAGLERVVALVQPTNLASRAVATKVGCVARGKIEHAGLPHLIYRLSLA
jgi:RimJ/RimL family protein N-acetyltransferase